MKLAGSKALVTGGAGFIGSHVVDALVRAGVSAITVVDDLSLGNLGNLAEARSAFPDLKFLEMDLAEDSSLKALRDLGAFDVCFHLAVIPLPASLVEPKRVSDRNLQMTTTVCEVQRLGCIRKLVHFSSSEVYGTARRVPMDETHPLEVETPYAASKAGADAVVQAYGRTFGCRVVSLRPFNNFGPRQNDKAYAGIIPIVVRRVQMGKPVEIFGDGDQTRDFIYAQDTARAALLLAERDDLEGDVFNIAGGREIRINELVTLLLEALNKPGHPVEHKPPRIGDVRRHLADTRKARERLDFSPGVPIREGLARTVEWYLSR